MQVQIDGYCPLSSFIGLVSHEKRFGRMTAVRQEPSSDRQSAPLPRFRVSTRSQETGRRAPGSLTPSTLHYIRVPIMLLADERLPIR
jgi:hypothetical protein